MKTKDTKPHIGLFGRRNNGKSSIINALTGQDIAIVSDVAGTTTDPVKKSIEIFGIGPVIIVDTAGIDDTGELGQKRVDKTLAAIKTVDLAVLIVANNQFGEPETKAINEFNKFEVPYIIVHNKADIEPANSSFEQTVKNQTGTNIINFSTKSGYHTNVLVNAMQNAIPETAYMQNSLLGNIIKRGDIVLLITPIDTEAPEGRMILPQVQVIRDVLDNHAVSVVCKESELDELLAELKPQPVLAITDSQVFEKANASVPKNIMLTSFSTVLAHFKGDFENYIKGTPAISQLNDGDRVLILESCTHRVSCDDIGRIKIPNWVKKFTGRQITFEVVAGLSQIPGKITDYALVIQCGGCMITRKQIISRLKPAVDAGIPVTNYGMAIAYMHGIYNRAVEPFTKKH